VSDFDEFLQQMLKAYGVRIKLIRRFGLIPMTLTRNPGGVYYNAYGLTVGHAKRRLLKKVGALTVWSPTHIPRWMR